MGGVAHGRVVFANQLRGVAALMVVLVHYMVVYQLMRPLVGWVVAAPQYAGPVPAAAQWLASPWLDGGAMGVAVFFLISGFVIPFSLANTTGPRFLLARALRIYPTFWAGLALQWTAVGLGAAYWHRPIVFGWQQFALNGLLLNTLAGTGSVDLVSWTLSIEVKFYLAAALLRPALAAGRVWPVMALALGAALLTRFGAVLPATLVNEAAYLPFMGIGLLFHLHYRGSLTHLRAAGLGLLLLAAWGGCWAGGPDAAVFWSGKPCNYIYALALFATAYAGRRHFRAWPVLDGLAAVSYPLYLVHSVLGFTIISFLTMAWAVPFPAAALAAFTAALAAATLLHRVVERPAVRIGRVLARSGADQRANARLQEHLQ